MKKIFIILFFYLFVFQSYSQKFPDVWENFSSSSFENNGNAYFQVFIDGEKKDNGTLVAMKNGECRGKVEETSVFPLTLENLFVYTLYSNETSENNISFQFYDPETCTIYNITETVDFVNDMIGDAMSPTILNGASESFVWNGTTENWNDVNNWENNIVPTDFKNVIINSSSVQPIINETISCFEHGNISGSKNTVCQRNLIADRWHYIGSPIKNATSKIFTENLPICDVYPKEISEADAVNGSIDNWTYINDETTLLSVGKGFGVWTTANTSFSFNGNLNTGDITINTYFSVEGWIFTSNPYPSAINWDHTSLDKSNITGAAYVWNGLQYLVRNGGIGSLTNGIIPANQGFFVQAITSGTFTFLNEARIHNNTAFYKKNENIVKNLLVFDLGNESVSDKTYISQNENATNDYDNYYDAHKLDNAENIPELYTMLDNITKYSINCFHDIEEISLCYKVAAEGYYKLTIDENSFDENIDVFLEDRQTNQLINLNDIQSYLFYSSVGEFTDRFKIKLNYTSMEIITSLFSSIYPNPAKDKLFVSGNVENANLKIYNLQGQLILEEVLTNDKAIDISKLALGFYTVKIQNKNDVFIEKFIKE